MTAIAVINTNMSQLFRITPLEKKNIEFYVDVYESLPNGDIRGFIVSEWYRWGQGFRELDNPVLDHGNGVNSIYCSTNIGWGCELDDLCSVYVEFQGEFTDDEKEEIEKRCRGDLEDEDGRWGTAWLFDGDHNWQVEDDGVLIYGPVKIDLVDEDAYNEVIKEDIGMEKYQPTAWPFADKKDE